MLTEIQTTNQETSLPFLSLLPDRHAHFTQASERQHHYELYEGHTPARKLLVLIWREKWQELVSVILLSFSQSKPFHLLFGDLGIPDVCAEIFYVIFF